MNCSVVVPVYNGEVTLPELLDRLEKVLSGIAESFEVILVNDGSPDRSWEKITRLSKTYKWVVGINLMRNYGQHNATLCGMRVARYDITITMDDDLQHPPEEIPTMLKHLNTGYDVVYGFPQEETHGLWRNIASKFTKWALQAAMGADIARQVSAFRAFRTDLREAFKKYQSPFVSIDVLLTWGTTKFSAVAVRHEEREFGASNYTFAKLTTHAFNMLTGFSTIPLQIASFIGFAFMGFGFLILCYVLCNFFLNGQAVPGFTFIAAIVAIFSGVQLFVLGIIGEYLARIHFRTFNKPPYVVRASIPRA